MYNSKNRIGLIGFLFLLFISSLQAQAKKALIVAVGTYAPGTSWSNISSTSDIPLIEEALTKQGFQKKDIVVLADSNATKTQIIAAFDQMIGEVKKGDMAYFHFSGHGQQVQDMNGDEIDGYDEAIVPYDANALFNPGVYEGENHLTDDELNKLYSQLRTKLGSAGHFLVTIDACHSGTSSRGLGIARGTEHPMASTTYVAKQSSRGTDQGQHDSATAIESDKSSMVAFFGAMAHQLNYEVKGDDGNSYGALSYAFSQAMTSVGSDASYRGLFDRMRLIMSARAGKQIPEAEGILDQAIMGGQFLGKPEYYIVKEWKDETSFTLNSGFLQGLRIGTVVGLFSPETRDYQNSLPIAKGTVTSSKAGSSTVSIVDSFTEIKIEEQYWIFVLEENFGDLIIRLQLAEDLLPSNLSNQLLALPFIEKTNQAADLIFLAEINKWKIVTSNDIEIASFAKTLSENILLAKLKKAIISFGQSAYIRKLEQENPNISLEFEFIPIAYEASTATEKARFPIASKMDRNGIIHFNEGDIFKIKVTNNGKRPAFYTLLDIQPDNKIQVLFPGANDSPADYKLMPRKSFEIPTPIAISPPYGQEIFKLIASRKPIDLRSIEQSRGELGNAAKPANPFEKLFAESFYNEELASRGGKTMGLPAGLVHIYSKIFIID